MSFMLCLFYPQGKFPNIHWIGGWVGPTAGLDTGNEKNILPVAGIEPRFLGHPGCSLVAITTVLFWLPALSNGDVLGNFIDFNLEIHVKINIQVC
jgi:hypothetical protein